MPKWLKDAFGPSNIASIMVTLVFTVGGPSLAHWIAGSSVSRASLVVIGLGAGMFAVGLILVLRRPQGVKGAVREALGETTVEFAGTTGPSIPLGARRGGDNWYVDVR